MSETFLKVRLARFEPARPFSRDVYLNLALNGRYVRIVCSGDEISPALLAKLTAKKIEFLHVPTNGDEKLDPESFPLYLEIAGEAAPGALTVEPAAELAGPNGTAKEAVVKAAPGAESRFSAEKPEAEAETRISGDQRPQDDGLVTIKGSKDEPSQEQTVFSNQAELNDEGIILLGRLKVALIGEKIASEAANLRQQVSEATLKDRKKHRREYAAMAEASERAASSKINTIIERKYPVAEDLQKFSALGEGKSTPDLISAASDRMLVAIKTADNGRKLLAETDKLITESERFRDSPVLRSVEKKLAELPQNESEKQKLVKEIKKTFVIDKISEEILKFSASTKEKEPEQRFGAELASLERALETISSGEELPEEVERRFSADKEAEEFVTVFTAGDETDAQKMGDQLKTIAAKRDQAMEELAQQRQESGLLRARNHRDLPATVSRLATYLGYSLGYSNVDMLSDLALTAILHFAKREENVQLSPGNIPPFVERVLDEREENDFVASDAKEILQILNEYLDNPECDREQKDFVKRVFDQSVDKLLDRKTEIDSINLAKWAKFVEKGPDLQGHSICVKASAAAIKQSKSIII